MRCLARTSCAVLTLTSVVAAAGSTGFERGPVSETLDNVRITCAGRLAQVFADFHFTSGGSTRHGQLMLALIEETGQFKIAALTFTYHLQ